jgi:DNA-binding GntR family transcriptional regulator
MVQLDSKIHRRPSLSSQVYDALTANLTTGKLEPGERIVVEHIADQLGVSPTPVREALARLVQEGLIGEEATGKLRVVPLTESYVSDTFHVRSALEGLAAELAALQIPGPQLAALRTAVSETGAALARGDYDVYMETDTYLHRAICDAAGNHVLARELQALQIHIDYIRGFSKRHSGEHLRQSHQEHLYLLDALDARDPVAARRAMEQHIRGASTRISQLINFQDTRQS